MSSKSWTSSNLTCQGDNNNIISTTTIVYSKKSSQPYKGWPLQHPPVRVQRRPTSWLGQNYCWHHCRQQKVISSSNKIMFNSTSWVLQSTGLAQLLYLLETSMSWAMVMRIVRCCTVHIVIWGDKFCGAQKPRGSHIFWKYNSTALCRRSGIWLDSLTTRQWSWLIHSEW